MSKAQVPVEINAAASFAALARDLRRAGAGGLRRELYSGLQRAARPTLSAIREGAGTLPTRGGLAARVAGASITARAVTGGAGARIRFTARERKPVDVAALDRGRLRHPLFGNRGHWYGQAVPPGWFTRPIEERAETFRAELSDAVDRVERQISG